MRARLLPVLLAAAGVSCIDTGHHYGEEFSAYYHRPAEETTLDRVERMEILHWSNDPKKKTRIGYLARFETQVAGSRRTRDCWYIYDRTGTQRVGFITAEGVFYRFRPDGQLGERVGEYPLYDVKRKAYLPLGLKVFHGIDLGDNLEVENVDPYK